MYNKLVNNVSKHMSNHPALYITKNINCTLSAKICAQLIEQCTITF